MQGNPKKGGGGISYGATVCNSEKDQRISTIMVPSTSDMTADKLKTTNAAKLKKLALVCHVIESIFRHIFTLLSSHD